MKTTSKTNIQRNDKKQKIISATMKTHTVEDLFIYLLFAIHL